MLTTQIILYASLGGVLIGLASAAMLLFNGRIAGISGILEEAAVAPRGAGAWRWAFLAGLVGTGLLLALGAPQLFPSQMLMPRWALIVAGLCVGFGTRLGGGCTSGHGVCGMSRLSPRSIVATLTFMAFGIATVAVLRHGLGVLT